MRQGVSLSQLRAFWQEHERGVLDRLLWWTGYQLAQLVAVFDFGFPPSFERRFLEVAAGVGAPSLAAFFRGFHVTATDISAASVTEERLRGSFCIKVAWHNGN